MKDLNTKENMKEEQFEKIFKAYVNDIYRVCFYFSKDEKKAEEITEQVFIELYQELDEMDSDYIFSYLVYNAKRLSTNELSDNK